MARLTKDPPGFSIATGYGSASNLRKFSIAARLAARLAAPTSVLGFTFWW
jgi:hypothetical protein